MQLHLKNLAALFESLFNLNVVILGPRVTFFPLVSLKGATLTVEGGLSKGQRSSAVLRSPLFPPPIRNSSCTVRGRLLGNACHI